jgi:hypothetical protein
LQPSPFFLRKRLNEIAQAGDLVERLDGVAPRVEFGADLNLQAGAVTIQRNLVRLAKSVWQFGEPKTASGPRTIPLSSKMVKRLTGHRRAQNEARLKAGPKWKALDLVFCSLTGEPFHNEDRSLIIESSSTT